MPAPSLEFHPAVREDALAGYGWYLERSQRVADGFLAEVERGLRLIAADPESWPPHVLGARRCVLRKYPYSIVYKAGGDSIVIYALVHAKRRPDYWKGRLGWRAPGE